MVYEKSCGAVVVSFQNGLPLVLVEYMVQGHVSLPKGHMEEGEEEWETAAREIREETNLVIRIDEVFRHEVAYSPQPGIQKTVVFFMAVVGKPVGIRPQQEEVSEIRMMGLPDAVREMTYDTDKEVLYHASAYLSWRYFHRCPGGLEAFATKPLYREHAVDVHSHIIPGVDDGARTMKESLELARLDREEGMDVVFATPHYGKENGFAPDVADVRRKLEELRGKIDRDQGPCPYPLVYPGTEWYCSDEIVSRIRAGKALPMGNSDWYMVEFLEYGNVSEPADTMMRRLKKMKEEGIRTILAHPERYTAIQEDWDLAKRVCDLGVLLQVNAYDLYLNKHRDTRDLAQWMARERLISFIGSDMHGIREGVKSPKMKEGIRWLYGHVDEEYADDVVRRNAEKYLGVEKLPV